MICHPPDDFCHPLADSAARIMAVAQLIPPLPRFLCIKAPQLRKVPNCTDMYRLVLSRFIGGFSYIFSLPRHRALLAMHQITAAGFSAARNAPTAQL